jgi:restriction endonuclease S subunit
MEKIEKLREENKLLKETIKQLRKQLESYRKQNKNRYEIDRDFVSYHEEERE